MYKKNINEALKKYYDGESSLEEENQLFEMLNQDDLDEAYFLEKEQFMFFQKEKEQKLPLDFDDKIEKIITLQDKPPPPIISSFPMQNWFSIAAMLLLSLSLSWWIFRTEENNWHEYNSANQIQKEIVLPDGSNITLNKYSIIKSPAVFGTKREIYFEGEGFFNITANPKKPFIIHAENSTIEVLGTSFNIRNYSNESEIIVSVSAGKVAFSSLKNGLQEKVFLLKGEQAIYNKTSNRIIKSTPKPNHLAWKTNKLTFNNKLMSEVIDDLRKYFGISIEVENKAILNCHFNGEFQDLEWNTVLEVLAYSMNISYEIRGDTYILSSKGCPNEPYLVQ